MKSYRAEDFGPNGAAVAALIDRSSRLTGSEIEALSAERVIAGDAAWDAARPFSRDAAWDAAWDIAWDIAWDAARVTARDTAWGTALNAAWDAARVTAWAAVALVAQDLISEEVFDVLHGPWASVMER